MQKALCISKEFAQYRTEMQHVELLGAVLPLCKSMVDVLLDRHLADVEFQERGDKTAASAASPEM